MWDTESDFKAGSLTSELLALNLVILPLFSMCWLKEKWTTMWLNEHLFLSLSSYSSASFSVTHLHHYTEASYSGLTCLCIEMLVLPLDFHKCWTLFLKNFHHSDYLDWYLTISEVVDSTTLILLYFSPSRLLIVLGAPFCSCIHGIEHILF